MPFLRFFPSPDFLTQSEYEQNSSKTMDSEHVITSTEMQDSLSQLMERISTEADTCRHVLDMINAAIKQEEDKHEQLQKGKTKMAEEFSEP